MEVYQSLGELASQLNEGQTAWIVEKELRDVGPLIYPTAWDTRDLQFCLERDNEARFLSQSGYGTKKQMDAEVAGREPQSQEKGNQEPGQNNRHRNRKTDTKT